MKTRIYFLDNLRTFMIFLVIVLHSGLVYEMVLENIWIVSDPVKNNSIGLIRMYLDIFVMFTIFFISGYFIPFSVKSKSSLDFLISKFKRILLPWIIAVFTLIPAYKAIFLYSRGLPQEEWYTYFFFFERSGSDLTYYANNPDQNWLWFLPVLFVFQVVYLILYKTKLLSFRISLKTGIILTFLTGLAYSMIISTLNLKGWADTAIFHFQRERLLIYFASFLLGALCNKLKIFESKTKNLKFYVVVNVVLAISMTLFTLIALNLFFNIIDPSRNYYYVSEFVDKLGYYFFSLLLMLSFLYILVYTFRFSFNKSNKISNELNRNSYSVYIIHTVVLGIIALTLYDIQIPAFIKFFILTFLTFIISNMIIYSYKKMLQKTYNIKTVATLLVVVFILATAFTAKLGSNTTSAESLSSNYEKPEMSIHEAVISGNQELVKRHILAGTDPDEKEPSTGASPLITAATFGQKEIAVLLINSGASINYKNNDGSTPLHTAAFFGRKDIVEFLLEKSADVTLKNKAGSTPLESVIIPFENVEPIYDYFIETLSPLGFKLDKEQVKKMRPEIVEILKENFIK